MGEIPATKGLCMPSAALRNDNVRKEINLLLDKFIEPDSLQLVAKSMFKRGIDIPSDKWSLLNRLIMMVHGTMDARGAKAWFKIGRRVTKKNHFCILAPKIRTIKEDKDGEEVERKICIGFFPICVWPVEKTIGRDVDYKQDKQLPEFFGKELAKKWGIKIKQGFENPKFYAFYDQTKNEIMMATDSQQTFFHELSHAADKKINKKLKGGQQPDQEIAAEFSAAILMTMFGLKAGEKNAYNYIKLYADKMGKDPIDCIIPLISRISKIVTLITEENDALGEKIKNA